MSEKRRDSKNRILRTGESQEADGRYKFRYIDANGKRKSVYSWRLVATDSIPAGKRDNAPLREQEKVINRDLDDDIVPDGGGTFFGDAGRGGMRTDGRLSAARLPHAAGKVCFQRRMS